MKCVYKLIVVVCILLTGYAGGATSRRKLLQWAVDDTGCRTPDSDVGVCKPVNSCKPMVDFLHAISSIDSNTRKILNAYTCAYGDTVKVCCPNKPIRIDKPGNPSRDNPNKKLLPDECGLANVLVRISNGEIANLQEFPWQVALRYNTGRTNPFHCGGSLINNRYVLTAAHCVIHNNLKLTGVRLGEHDFNTNPDCIRVRRGTVCAPPFVDFNVTQRNVIVHERYTTGNPQNDIALIRLPKAVEFTDAVRPVCLPSKPEWLPNQLTRLTVAGWGSTEIGFASSKLLKVVVPYVENSACRSRFRGSGISISDGQLCAGGKDGKGSCNGDSGGPITHAVPIDGDIRSMQVGLVSYGSRICGNDAIPALYTRVSTYMDWIINNMKP